MIITSRARLLVVCAMLSLPPVGGAPAADPQIKPPIRGLVSMGAYRFVGKGGDPVNTLEPLNAKAGIFGGLVIIATWKQLQPTPTSEIGENNVIDQALADVRAYNARNPAKPLAVKLRVWGGFEAPDWAMELGVRRSPPSTTAGSVSSADSGAKPIERRGRGFRCNLPPSTMHGR
jgi:hypothetical protein